MFFHHHQLCSAAPSHQSVRSAKVHPPATQRGNDFGKHSNGRDCANWSRAGLGSLRTNNLVVHAAAVAGLCVHNSERKHTFNFSFNLSNKNEMTKLNRAVFTTTVAFDCGGVYSTQRLLARLSALRSRLRLGLVLVSREALCAK